MDIAEKWNKMQERNELKYIAEDLRILNSKLAEMDDNCEYSLKVLELFLGARHSLYYAQRCIMEIREEIE